MLPSSLSISLDRTDPRTLPVQLADRIRESIGADELVADLRLPSTRHLATELQVARGVVERAYEQLTAEGWLEPRTGSGTYVARLPADRGPRDATSVRGRSPHSPVRISLRPGTPWTSPHATTAWKRAWRSVGAAPAPGAYPDPAGELELRVAIAALLGRARALRTDPESIVITSGTTHGLGLALAALSPARSGAEPVVAMENPGYTAAASSATHFGWTVFDVPVDRHGLCVDLLDAAPATTRAVYVTPSHQYPTGGLLTIARRRALAEYARQRDVMIFEDDYDSEFRYDVAPLPTLSELAPDRTVYLGTVAKTLGAGVRLGWMVAPPALVRSMCRLRTAIADFPSVPLQQAMVSLIRDGEWDRTVRTTRRIYRARDHAVSDALARFGELRGAGAGLHTSLILDAATAEHVKADAASAGVELKTIAESTRGQSDTAGIVVGYGSVTDDQFDSALTVLIAALERRTVS